MKVTVRGMRKHSKHQLHVSTWHEPNWFEKWILAKSPGVVNYVGKGSKWFIMEMGTTTPVDFTPVTNKTLLAMLKKIHP